MIDTTTAPHEERQAKLDCSKPPQPLPTLEPYPMFRPKRETRGLGKRGRVGKDHTPTSRCFRKGGRKPHTNRPTSDDGAVRDFKSPSCKIHDGAGSGMGAECKETLHSRDRAKRFTWANDAKQRLPRGAQTSACKECLETRWRHNIIAMPIRAHKTQLHHSKDLRLSPTAKSSP